MDDYGDPMRTVEINRAEAEWRRNQIVVTREHDKNERIIKSFCDYIWKTFKKDEGKQCFDEGELGYFTGRYIRMKTIVESDEFKKLEALVEKKEESNESV